jgi:hypothetical protein
MTSDIGGCVDMGEAGLFVVGDGVGLLGIGIIPVGVRVFDRVVGNLVGLGVIGNGVGLRDLGGIVGFKTGDNVGGVDVGLCVGFGDGGVFLMSQCLQPT